MNEVLAILIVTILGLIAVAGVVIGYFIEVQQFDRYEIGYWRKRAEAARQFEVYVSEKVRNGIRKVWMARRES